jgi:xanthine dehydrogenase accessory factor
MKLDILKSLNAERAARRAAVVVTDVASGEQRLVKAADVAGDPLHALIEKRIRSGKSGMEETPDGKVFLTVHVPPAQLVITGAVHISQALAPIAKLLGYDVTIVDPRTAFASIERFPDVKVIAEWPDVALPPLGIDRYTAFVALTHGRRLERLKGEGVSDAALARIHAPIGLDIGAVSPSEIAVAIMGEITARLRKSPEKAA